MLVITRGYKYSSNTTLRSSHDGHVAEKRFRPAAVHVVFHVPEVFRARRSTVHVGGDPVRQQNLSSNHGDGSNPHWSTMVDISIPRSTRSTMVLW